jgi:KDO2-lipid IV(A) lauroyltransferase
MLPVKLLVYVFAIVPDRCAMALARILNPFFYRRLTRGGWKFIKSPRVIPKLFPDRSPRWREGVIRRNSLHYVKLAMEMLKAHFITDRGLMKKTYIREGKSHLVRLLESGNGFVILTGHLGNFEYAAAYIGTVYRTVYAPVSVSNTAGSRLMNWIRQGHHVALIEVRSRPRASTAALGRMIHLLNRGEPLFLVADQRGKGGEYRGTLFGTRQKLYGGPFVLGKKTGKPFLPMYSVRDEKNRIAIHFLEPFFLNGQDTAADIRKVTDFFELMMREHPDQYLWDRDNW